LKYSILFIIPSPFPQPEEDLRSINYSTYKVHSSRVLTGFLSSAARAVDYPEKMVYHILEEKISPKGRNTP